MSGCGEFGLLVKLRFLLLVSKQIVPDSSTTLTLSLNHPKAQVRQMAVKHLAQIAPDGEVLYVKFIVACAVSLPCAVCSTPGDQY